MTAAKRQIAVGLLAAGRRAGRSRASRTADRSASSRRTATGAGSATCEDAIRRGRRRACAPSAARARARAARPASCSAAIALVRRLNRAYRGKDAAHQRAVVSLPAAARRGRRAGAYLGDVVLAAETVRRGGGRARHRARPPSPAPRRARPPASRWATTTTPTPPQRRWRGWRPKLLAAHRRCRSLRRRRRGLDP